MKIRPKTYQFANWLLYNNYDFYLNGVKQCLSIESSPYSSFIVPTHNWQFDEDTFGHWLYSDDDWHFKKEK